MGLTSEEIEAVEAAELEIALEALDKRKRPLTKREGALIERAKVATAPTADPLETAAALAARLKCNPRNVQRMREVEALAGVPPIPWDDMLKLREWYRLHYRSDVSKAPTGNARLPDWLKEPAAVQVSFQISDGPVDVIGDMKTIVARKRAQWQASPDNSGLQDDYFAALNDFTQAEKRFLQNGGSGYAPLARVEAFIATVHSRLPKRLEADLCAMFPEVRRALSGANAEAAYKALMSDLCIAMGRRLAESKFSES